MQKQTITPLQRYIEMINNYRIGMYGNKHLTLNQILKISGNDNLLYEMSIEELSYLKEKSFGMLKLVFQNLINQRNKTTYNTRKRKIEKRWSKWIIDQY